MESISEAFNKCFVADFIFSLSRTADDTRLNTGRIFYRQEMNGPDGLVFQSWLSHPIVQMKVLERPTDEEEGIDPHLKFFSFIKKKYAQLGNKRKRMDATKKYYRTLLST